MDHVFKLTNMIRCEELQSNKPTQYEVGAHGQSPQKFGIGTPGHGPKVNKHNLRWKQTDNVLKKELLKCYTLILDKSICFPLQYCLSPLR